MVALKLRSHAVDSIQYSLNKMTHLSNISELLIGNVFFTGLERNIYQHAAEQGR
jgi:hypothetical protein